MKPSRARKRRSGLSPDQDALRAMAITIGLIFVALFAAAYFFPPPTVAAP